MRMRVCATYGSVPERRANTCMEEFRLDVFEELPEDIGENTIITLCDKGVSDVPDGFEGLVDAGDSDNEIPFRKIRSVHDFDGTPTEDSIVDILSRGEQEVSKFACRAESFRDLDAIYKASRRVGRKHVILGMGEIGTVTRIRQGALRNEFTFGYAGKPTAPGQLSAEEMGRLGDDCEIVGIAGHPLGHTLSPRMQNAAMGAARIRGIYLKFDSPDTVCMTDVVEEYGIRGINVTMPHKERAIAQLDSLDAGAGAIGAVNTVVNDGGKLRGCNTDADGVDFAFRNAGRELADHDRMLIFGSGGAARAAAYAAVRAGCRTSVLGRNARTVGALCRDIGAEIAEGDSVSGYDAIVNCTPVGMDGDSEYMFCPTGLKPEQTVMDCVCNRRTRLVAAAEERGCRIASGKDMLVGQGAKSFELWFGKWPDTDAMREAIE